MPVGRVIPTGLCSPTGNATTPRYLRHMWQLSDGKLLVVIQHDNPPAIMGPTIQTQSGLYLHLLEPSLANPKDIVLASRQISSDVETTCDGILDESAVNPILRLVIGPNNDGKAGDILYFEITIDFTNKILSRTLPETVAQGGTGLECDEVYCAYPSIGYDAVLGRIWVAYREETRETPVGGGDCVTTFAIHLKERTAPGTWTSASTLYGVVNTSSYKYAKLLGGDGGPILMVMYDSDPEDFIIRDYWFSAFEFTNGNEPDPEYPADGNKTKFLAFSGGDFIPPPGQEATHWSVAQAQAPCGDVVLTYVESGTVWIKTCDATNTANALCGCRSQTNGGGCPDWDSGMKSPVGPPKGHYPGVSIDPSNQAWIPIGGGEKPPQTRYVGETMMGASKTEVILAGQSYAPARVVSPEKLAFSDKSLFLFSWEDTKCGFLQPYPPEKDPVFGHHQLLGLVTV